MAPIKSRSKIPTMHDVAKLAGVSQPTVSRVLNGNSTQVPISDDTRQKVQWAVEKLGYRPNAVARSLRTQRTQTVALMIADISNSFYHPIARAVQDVARQYDYEVLISNSDHIYDYERHFCEIVLRRGVDGAILVPTHLTADELDNYASQTHIPFVVLGHHINHPNIDVVYMDDELATYETTLWLIRECGHAQVGYIGVPPFYPPGPRRLSGFTRAMMDTGLAVNPHFVLDGDFTLEGGKRVAQQLIQQGTLPSALMVANDLMAIGIILALQDAGYRVPEDVAIVGFDDIPEATIVRPTLTTIAQNPGEIGERLANALFERIEDSAITERRVFSTSYALIQRDST
jgi:LacI family transcriptional regulator